MEGWSELELADLDSKELSGGASGQRVLKVFLVDPQGRSPDCVMCKTCNVVPGKTSMAEAALKAFGQASEETNFCGKVYLAGDPRFPGLIVTEFAAGSMMEGGHMYDEIADCRSYGRLLGLLHSHDQSWFLEEYHNTDKSVELLGQAVPESVVEAFVQQAQTDKYGRLLFNEGYLFTEWGNMLPTSEVYQKSMAMVPAEQREEAQRWFADAAGTIMQTLDLGGEQNGLMDRLVICHGDCHVKQFLHREADAGKLLMVDFDLMHRAPAWYDWGPIPVDWFTAGGMHGTMAYPSLDKRRHSAQAYLDAVGPETAAQFARNTVDDIVFDVNKGIVGRLCFMSWVMVFFAGVIQKDYASWFFLAVAQKSAELIKQAEQDEGLKAAVLEEGVLSLVLEQNAEALTEFGSNKTPEVAQKISGIPLGPVVVKPSSCAIM